MKKGQTLLVISSPDLASAFSEYQKAKADEVLSRTKLSNARRCFTTRGAIAAKDLEAAQDTEDKAKVDVETAEHRVRMLGADPASSQPAASS